MGSFIFDELLEWRECKILFNVNRSKVGWVYRVDKCHSADCVYFYGVEICQIFLYLEFRNFISVDMPGILSYHKF